jgi:exportin-2 (importin alpha re-exporter)
MVIESLILPTALKVTGVIERKMVAIALTRLLTETPKMLEVYSGSWTPLLQAAVGLLEGQQQEDIGGEDDKPLFFEAEEQEITAFTQLSFAQRADPADPFVDINPKAFLATQLQALSSRFPGKLPALIPSQLHPLIQAYGLQAELTPPYLH